MEKQANRLQNSISVVLVCTALFFTLIANSQTKVDSIAPIKKDTLTQNISFVEGKEYVLGGISVKGLKKFSEEIAKQSKIFSIMDESLVSRISILQNNERFIDRWIPTYSNTN